MKKFIGLILFLSPFLADAKIWTVDNTPGSGADTTSLQGCIDQKASAGDTIILMPSHIGYGGLNLYKKIFLYSRSHSNNNLDKDRSATLSSVYIATSGGNSGAGSTFKGLRVTGGFNINVNNIHIQNCYIGGTNYIYQSNALIEGCVFELQYYEMIYFTTSSNNNILAHNYISKYLTNVSMTGPSYAVFEGGNSSNLLLNNNIFEISSGSSVSGGGIVFFRNSYLKIYNNILWSNVTNRTRFDTLSSGPAFKNNLTYSVNSNPNNLSGTGNINDSLPVFETNFTSSFLPSYRTTNDMRLKSTSPGRNRGTDSTDVGLYGGNYKFSITGNVPGVAIFDDFEVLNPVIKKGDVLKVKINARKPD